MALSKSERIQIIRGISDRLEEEEWPIIDLTLDQFGFETIPEYQGGKTHYIIQVIGRANDEDIAALGAHVGLNVETAAAVPEPAFWRDGMLRVFVSHLAANRAYAAELQSACEEFGLSCFVAHNDIEPTLEWQSQIEAALSTCHALVALIHSDFHASKWTDQEIGYAMGRGVPVFSVCFGEDPYGFIGKHQAFNGVGKTCNALAKELFDTYRKNKQTEQRMADVVVRLVESSTSYAAARDAARLLSLLEVWNPSFTTRLESAMANNSQVSGAFHVPGIIRSVIGRWEPNRAAPSSDDDVPF